MPHSHNVPHLTTSLSGPLLELEKHLLENQTQIETWFRCQWLETPAPFYASVDLRNSGFKLAPVDTNLFSAGFNNLNPAFAPLCIQAIQSAVDHILPTASKILIIPENHTRNTGYLESLATLSEMIQQAGFEVRIGSLQADLEQANEIKLPSERAITLHPVIKTDDKISTEGFEPHLILLNNDLTEGRPTLLENIQQPLTPPLEMGWSTRLKSSHFIHYRHIAEKFAEMIDIDPWLINPMFRQCGEINFMKREGEECLEKNVATLLKAIQKKYDQYGLTEKPFVIIKSDTGTYGMGVMTVYSAEEITSLNRKQRTKMASSKGGGNVERVIIQEGVYTFETWGKDNAVAEPVVYMIDHFVVGGFYRVHTGRSSSENLNAAGMQFEPLEFASCCNTPDRRMEPDAEPNRFYAYGVIARLALLAASREIAEV